MTCRACNEDKPLDQFRPGRSMCIGYERESARLRAARRYETDPEWRLKQLANAKRQHKRRRAT